MTSSEDLPRKVPRDVPFPADSSCGKATGLLLAQQPGGASIHLRYQDHQYAILQISRGMGPRALEQWLAVQAASVWGHPLSTRTVMIPGLLESSEQHKLRILSPHYRAYAQNLVLVERRPSPSLPPPPPSFVVTVHAILKGKLPTQSMNLSSAANGAQTASTRVRLLRSVPSNTAGNLSLVELTAAGDEEHSMLARQFRLHLAEAGYPILGKAQGSQSFRGQALLMATTCLQVNWKGTTPAMDPDAADVQSTRTTTTTVVIDSPALFTSLLDREERFWHQRNGDQDVPPADIEHVPLPKAYREGRVSFDGLDLVVTPAVMIPRPGSLTLVDCATLLWRHYAVCDEAPVVLDLGTGSGCLLLALLQRFPRARGYGVDISAAALEVARTNASTLGGDPLRCQLQHASFETATCPEQANLIVCNPPYHIEGGAGRLEAATLLHEPSEALFVGRQGSCDPLSAYHQAWQAVERLAASGSVVAMEVCRHNATDVYQFLHQAGLVQISMARDTKGCIRSIQGIYVKVL
jgi:release factor glutamine methyltransferase